MNCLASFLPIAYVHSRINGEKKDVKLMKKFISEEIMLSFPAPHKLDLSVRSDINESGDNEKGEIIEG